MEKPGTNQVISISALLDGARSCRIQRWEKDMYHSWVLAEPQPAPPQLYWGLTSLAMCCINLWDSNIEKLPTISIMLRLKWPSPHELQHGQLSSQLAHRPPLQPQWSSSSRVLVRYRWCQGLSNIKPEFFLYPRCRGLSGWPDTAFSSIDFGFMFFVKFWFHWQGTSMHADQVQPSWTAASSL